MTTFIFIIATIYLIKALTTFLALIEKDYPRTISRDRALDILSMIVRTIILFVAIHLLIVG
jgi:hypothetical protein